MVPKGVKSVAFAPRVVAKVVSCVCAGWVSFVIFHVCFGREQKYVATVQKNVKGTEQQRAAEAAKTKKMAAKEVRNFCLLQHTLAQSLRPTVRG